MHYINYLSRTSLLLKKHEKTVIALNKRNIIFINENFDETRR